LHLPSSFYPHLIGISAFEEDRITEPKGGNDKDAEQYKAHWRGSFESGARNSKFAGGRRHQ
jgi:hypothetical protein